MEANRIARGFVYQIKANNFCGTWEGGAVYLLGLGGDGYIVVVNDGYVRREAGTVGNS